MDLQWSPQTHDHLITWGQDISLFKVEDHVQNPVHLASSRISETQSISLISKITEWPYPRLVQPHPGGPSESLQLIAIGLGNGKIVITSFSNSPSGVIKELVPKHSRLINSLTWNKSSPNLLAAGFDKVRSEYSFSIWDVQTSTRPTNGPHSDLLRPVIELGANETAHSLAWVLDKTILVGMNGKHLKLFDLRDPSPKLGSTASTKGVYGLTVDANEGHRVASYADNSVFVWDMRNFDKPFVVLNHGRAVSKIGWCPTRSGLLAVLEKDSTGLTMHDVHHAVLSAEEGEPVVLERKHSPAYPVTISPPSVPLCAFDWHPSLENMITTANMGGSLWNSIVFERVTLNWSPSSVLSWSNGKKVLQFIDHTDEFYSSFDDISTKMKTRALNGYGLKNPLKDNARLVDEEGLKQVWEWLDFAKNLTEREKNKSGMKYPGVKSILKIEGGVGTLGSRSELIINNSFDLHNNKTYKSDERSFIQALCGWDTDEPSGQSPNHTRRAAICLFHLKLRQAIRILNEAGQGIVAMAISGFTDEKNSLWRDQTLQNFSTIQDPYVRAIFTFLTDTESNYELILNDPGLALSDRIGFACSFLTDPKLTSFILGLCNDLVKRGDLNGILLTGMTPNAIPLFQRYLDLTGDIQTVSLLAIRTMAGEIPSNIQLKSWIDRYRELLDSWKLWEQRAEFDIIKNKNNPSLIPPPEVTVSCNFCGKNISPGGLGGLARTTHLFSRFTTTSARIKLSCCPSCRKPLPRCCICLLHMGTILGSDKGSDKGVVSVKNKAPNEASSSWYSWCQSCRHGGHTIHLMTWFENQTECPVLQCPCKCATLDKIDLQS